MHHLSTDCRETGLPRDPHQTKTDPVSFDILEGRIEPGRVFDRTVRLDDVPDGYRAMNERKAIKVMVEV